MTVKSTQDAKWEVKIIYQTVWVIKASIKGQPKRYFFNDTTKEKVQARWKTFAKRNGIKNWEYV